jgi:hypothetical protein
MTSDSFKPTLPRMAVRFAIAVAGSLCVHVLFVSGAMRGLADVFHWTSNAEPAPIQVRARLAEAPPAPAPAPAPLPPRRKPIAKPVDKPSTPAAAIAPESPAIAQASAPASAPAELAPAELAPAELAPAPLPPPAATPTPSLEPAPPPPPPAAAPRPEKVVPLPRRATIALELTLESNNYKVWATQQWEMADGRYRVLLTAEAKALFFTLGSILLESNGVVSADGLRPERYVDERNKRRTTVEFSANEKTAYVEESNGNRKTLALAGQAADIMSLTYDLAFNPDINVGAPFTLSNRDTVEEIRLVTKREESLAADSGTRLTRFYDFRRPDGSGGIQVWLSPENGWLPAKIRILGRDGALTMVATRYDLNPPDSR